MKKGTEKRILNDSFKVRLLVRIVVPKVNFFGYSTNEECG